MFPNWKVWGNAEKYRKFNSRVPWRHETVNQSTLPIFKKEKQKKKNSFGLCPAPIIFLSPTPSKHKLFTRLGIHTSQPHIYPLLLSHSVSVFSPLELLVSVEPRSQGTAILISEADFRSVECDNWKFEAPGAKVVLDRVCVAYSLSLITRRTEFIHANNRIRGDCDTSIIAASWQFGGLTFSLIKRCLCTPKPTQAH